MKLLLLKLRPIPKSVWRNTFEAEDVPHVEVWPQVELTPYQTKKVNQAKAWWDRGRVRIYEASKKCTHLYLNGNKCWHCGKTKVGS